MKRAPDQVWCASCKTVVGTIYEVEERQGFYRNECKPNPMPKYCEVCETVLTRLANTGGEYDRSIRSSAVC